MKRISLDSKMQSQSLVLSVQPEAQSQATATTNKKFKKKPPLPSLAQKLKLESTALDLSKE